MTSRGPFRPKTFYGSMSDSGGKSEAVYMSRYCWMLRWKMGCLKELWEPRAGCANSSRREVQNTSCCVKSSPEQLSRGAPGEVWGRTLRCGATPSISASRLHPSPARLRAEERGLGKGTLPRRGDGGGWQGSAAGSVPRREAVLGREWF